MPSSIISKLHRLEHHHEPSHDHTHELPAAASPFQYEQVQSELDEIEPHDAMIQEVMDTNHLHHEPHHPHSPPMLHLPHDCHDAMAKLPGNITFYVALLVLFLFARYFITSLLKQLRGGSPKTYNHTPAVTVTDPTSITTIHIYSDSEQHPKVEYRLSPEREFKVLS
ncbi:uncharacterized protein BDV14DRAFT_175175 [Aspergillus stella-maris]|uniref:uncharacterized protein n=1 Tax=Aspergillus stella-maris TaxID=1810926 RepID=UPI003CCC923F